MTRLQAFLIALAVGFAVVAGSYAALQTTRLGAVSTTPVSVTAITHQRRALDRTAAALHKALKQRPPKLPAVQHPAPPAPRVVYVPGPSPVVTTQTPVGALPRQRVSARPVTRLAATSQQTYSVKATVHGGAREPRDPQQPVAAPATTTTTAAAAPVAPPTTTTAPPTTTSHSSPPPPSGGGGDGHDGGGADD